ncbi:MAG: M48 family metallopeptidase [Betaproteobacteria bacterium]|nr:M48 family metallopeptidase [Betaproteobacteria bacterium]
MSLLPTCIRVVCRSLVLLLLLTITLALPAHAELDQSKVKPFVAPVSDAWRAALPTDPVKATDAYLARIDPAAKAKSDAYYEGGYWLQLWNFLLGLAIAWLLLASRWSARVRSWAERLARRWPLQALLYALFYIVVSFVLSLPLTIYQGFVREHQYGFATQTFWPWFGEQITALAVNAVIGSVALLAVYTVIRRAPRTWWVWGTVVSIGLLAFVVLISPLYIDPLFNTYKPLPPGPVRDKILSLARANSIPATDVYEFDASRQTTRISANVSGLGGTTAIRLNDNLLLRTSQPEIEGVMAHEMGHYVLNHIYKMLVMFGVLLAAGFAFVSWAAERVIARVGARWQLRGVSDLAALPLLAALLSMFMFAATPIVNTIIRTQEAEADIFGLNASRQPDGFAEVDLKLVEYRKADPGPIEEFLFYDHPAPRKRIEMAMRWKAENLPR